MYTREDWKQHRSSGWKVTWILIALIGIHFITYAQQPLDKYVSLNVNRQKLSDVLDILSNQGNFYFSYSSSSIPRDSLVSLSIRDKTVRQVLDQLLAGNYVYRASGNYIIIKKSPIQ